MNVKRYQRPFRVKNKKPGKGEEHEKHDEDIIQTMRSNTFSVKRRYQKNIDYATE